MNEYICLNAAQKKINYVCWRWGERKHDTVIRSQLRRGIHTHQSEEETMRKILCALMNLFKIIMIKKLSFFLIVLQALAYVGKRYFLTHVTAEQCGSAKLWKNETQVGDDINESFQWSFFYGFVAVSLRRTFFLLQKIYESCSPFCDSQQPNSKNEKVTVVKGKKAPRRHNKLPLHKWLRFSISLFLFNLMAENCNKKNEFSPVSLHLFPSSILIVCLLHWVTHIRVCT